MYNEDTALFPPVFGMVRQRSTRRGGRQGQERLAANRVTRDKHCLGAAAPGHKPKEQQRLSQPTFLFSKDHPDQYLFISVPSDF